MKNYTRFGTFFLTLLLCIVVPNHRVIAQETCDFSGKLSLDIQLAPIISESQVLRLADLGIDSEGFGAQIVTFIMRNETNEELENLFFEMSMSAGNSVLARVTQQAAYPFSLDPQQLVYATNNNVVDEELPGVDDEMRFDGGLTTEGEEFIENLENPTELPANIYSVFISISQVTNACGRVVLAEQTVEFGGGESGTAIVDELSIALRAPGAELGSNTSISNSTPQLSWEGDPTLTYRVVVVSDEGDLELNSKILEAKGNELMDVGTPDASLVEYEYLDVLVEGTNFLYPTAGTRALEPGRTYYWEVSTLRSSSGGSEEIVSDIWSFRLIDPSDQTLAAAQEIDEETIQALIALVGVEFYTTLSEDGFFFESIELDQQTFSGITGIQKLAEILGKINDGDIIVSDN